MQNRTENVQTPSVQRLKLPRYRMFAFEHFDRQNDGKRWPSALNAFKLSLRNEIASRPLCVPDSCSLPKLSFQRGSFALK